MFTKYPLSSSFSVPRVHLSCCQTRSLFREVVVVAVLHRAARRVRRRLAEVAIHHLVLQEREAEEVLTEEVEQPNRLLPYPELSRTKKSHQR